jgi:hypothetical protein
MDSDRPTLTIKLKPYLAEFLKCRMVDRVARKKSFVGTLLRPFITNSPPGYIYKPLTGDDVFTFELPYYDDFNVRRGSAYISEKNMEEFERILNAHFWDLFFSFMDDKMRYTTSIKKCILQFCADNSLSFNESTYEMFNKAYYRKRMNRNEKPKRERRIFGSKLSVTCPLIFLL